MNPPAARRASGAQLAACALVLLLAYFFFFFVVPTTPVRLAKPSAELADRFGLWRAVRAAPLQDLHGTPLAIALGAAIGTACAVHLLAVVLARRASPSRALLAGAVSAAVVFVAASTLALPNLDTDIYTYIATGRVAAVHHADPYAVATDRFPGDPYLRYAAPQYTHYPDVKLPAWMPIDVGLVAVAGDDPVRGLLTFRVGFAVLDLACLALVLLIVRRLRPARLLEASVAWGWSPITVLFAQSKVDTAMVFYLLVASLLLVHGHRVAALCVLVLSVLVKLLTAPLLAVLWLDELRSRRYRELVVGTVAAVVIVAALYAPYTRPLHLLGHHLTLLHPTLVVAGLPAAAGLVAIGRARTPEELLRLWGIVALAVGILTLPTGFPWYLLATTAVASIIGDLRLTAGVSVLACVSLVLYERHGTLVALPLLAPTPAVVATALALAAAARRRSPVGAS